MEWGVGEGDHTPLSAIPGKPADPTWSSSVLKTHHLPFIACLFVASPACAAALMWDTVIDGAQVTQGNGTWNTTNTTWNNGTLNVAWSNAPVLDAIFPGTASGVTTVTIGANPLTAGNITVNGDGGTMVLAGTYANLNANGVTIQTTGEGKLALTTNGTLSNVASVSIANGATLFLSQATVSSSISVTGSGNTENRGALRLESNARVQGTVTLLGNSTFGSTVGTGVIESTVTGNFAFHQAAISPGTVRITGNNGFTGGTTIATGAVQAGHNSAFGSGTLTLNGGTLSSDSTTARSFANAGVIGGSVTLGNATNSGKLTFANTVQSNPASISLTTVSNVEFADLRAAGGVNHSGAGQLVVGSFTALSSNAAITGNAITLGASGTTFDTNGFNATISAPLTGAAGFMKTGAGTLSLSGAGSSFSGPVQVVAGTLRLVPSVTLPANLDVMPAGDSITFGANGGYRVPLYNSIQAIAPGFHFVGDSTLSPGTLPANQRNHAGHSSYSSIDIHNNLDGLDKTTFNQYGGADRNPNGGYWLTGRPVADAEGPARPPLFPDVILLLVGANDVFRLSMNAQQAHASYTALLTKITTLRPDAEIFMAKITPHANATEDQKAIAYNAAVEQVYNEFKAAGKRVTLVDLHTGYTGGLPDNLHPDAAGYAWMADRWRDALIATLGIEQPGNFRNSPSITVQAGATLEGSALVNQLNVQGTLSPGGAIVGSMTPTGASISGSYRCDLSATTCDRLAVEGNLVLTNATLDLHSLGVPAVSVFPIATYTGEATGSFTTISGLPAGFRLVHDTANKRFIIATPYAAWRVVNGLPETSVIPDADHDGTTDWFEFATGGDPADAQNHGTWIAGLNEVSGEQVLTMTIATRTGADFTIAPDNAMTATIDGITYRVECSADLEHWDGELIEIAPLDGNLPPAPAGYIYRTFKALDTLATSSRNFIRLKLTGENLP